MVELDNVTHTERAIVYQNILIDQAYPRTFYVNISQYLPSVNWTFKEGTVTGESAIIAASVLAPNAILVVVLRGQQNLSLIDVMLSAKHNYLNEYFNSSFFIQICTTPPPVTNIPNRTDLNDALSNTTYTNKTSLKKIKIQSSVINHWETHDGGSDVIVEARAKSRHRANPVLPDKVLYDLLNPQSSTFNPQPLNPQPSNLNPSTPQPLNPSTLNP